MRLSHIKLAGFKSFVDPTHFHLPGQIVGIVGPNGCGKSNVIDALRWVLGESRASALRGESMQDVIFNGSGQRKAIARASVELVFDNTLGRAAGQWSSYAEIAIKRVLLRNGESTYFINNQKVRRRDITDIFLGTGLGARAYAIVEQGMISRIIEAKPEELRVFLEEAAGVSKYRDRRRETSQRLNETRDNLLRVGDILQEMDHQLVHLTAQAATARQYRELETQRDSTQQLLWLLKKQQAELLQSGFAQQIEAARTELEARTAALRLLESQLETQRSEHYRLTDLLGSRQGELYGANGEVARLEQQIQHAQQQQQRLTQQIAALTLQVEQQQQQYRTATEQLAHWQSEQCAAELKQALAQQQAQAAGESLPQAEQAARTSRAKLNELQREQLQLRQQFQLAQTQHANLQRNIGQLAARQTRLLQEQESLPLPDESARQLLLAELTEVETRRLDAERERLQLQTQLPAAEQTRQRQRAALQQHERQTVQLEARLHALQVLQQQVDGDQQLSGWLQQQGLAGAARLWQALRIVAGWETALEAVLRERLNALALPKLTDALVWRQTPPARLAVFASRPDDACESDFPPSLDAGSEQLKPLLDYVQCQDEQVRPVLREWLASVYTVADVAQALASQLPGGACLVTPEGHLIGAHGLLFYAPDSQLHGVLTRQREIEQLVLKITLNNQIVDKERLLTDETVKHCREIEAQIPPLQTLSSQQTQRQHVLQMQLLKLDQATERCRERSAQIARELQELAESLSTEQAQQAEFAGQMTQLQAQTVSLQLQLDEVQQQDVLLEGALEVEREQQRQRQHRLQEANFFMRTCTDKISDLQKSAQLLAAALAQSGQNLKLLHDELSGSQNEVAAQQLQQALAVRGLAEQTLSDARNALEQAAAEFQTRQQARLSCEHSLNQLREKLAGLALREQEARLYAEQWAAQLQGVDEAVLLPLLASAKPVQLQNELNRLNRSIEELGAVNLAALEELQTASERKLYLDAQALDLQQAMATLEDAIRHIDRESRELLMDTFNQVNVQLAELFPVLFAGGEARLVMTGDEILEGGVQVMAQPPGKKNSSIHLLSGGEKALTAIALIFSLFQLNPAPFCLLDEVDAPLDDTNTERLCALVKKMSQHTQFVFISHNKIAMEMAQQLIGVTMQEKGVSKVVSVDIEAALRLREAAVISV